MILSFFRPNARIRREAADWFVRLDRDPSEQNLRRFNEWLAGDPRRQQAYDRIAAIWSGSSQLFRPAGEQPRRLIQPGGGIRYALAAGIAFLLLGTGTLLPALLTGRSETAILSTRLNQSKNIALPDGTSVTLAPGSRAVASFSGKERRLSLQLGKARFRVARESRPFIVQANGHELSGNGSDFDLSCDPAGASLAVHRGEMEVRRTGLWGSLFAEPLRVGPGRRLVLGEEGVKIEEAEPPKASMIRFDNVRLGEAVQQFNLASGTKLKIVGDARNLSVSGAFRAGDSAGFARSLAAAFDLIVEAEPDGSLALTQSR